MTKQLLTVEFRYYSVQKPDLSGSYNKSKVTIGIYDTIEEAVKFGNDTLQSLSGCFDFGGDKFKVNGLYGRPNRLVCDYSSKHKVQVFCNIEELNFDDLTKVMKDALNSQAEYMRWAHKK